jgi:hypothetical protein
MTIKQVTYIDSNLINEQTSEIAKPVEIKAVGYLVSETDIYITLAREIVESEYRGQISIPKISIIE